jgi:hypothetical protein
MQFPLGSGLFGMGQQDPNMQMMTQFPSHPLIRKPRTPLGSGMFDTEASPPKGDFPLGSGLFGQQMPAPNIQQGGATPQPMQQQPAPGGGMTPTWDQKFGDLLNNPAFQFGLSLLGSSHSANPWGSALQTALNAQMASANSKRQQGLAEQDKRRVDIEEKGLGLRGKEIEQTAENQRQMRELQKQNLEQDYALGLRKVGIDEGKLFEDQRQFDAGEPLRDAQAGYYGAQAGGIQGNLNLKGQELAQERALAERNFNYVNGLFGGAPNGSTGALPVPPIVPSAGQPQRAPIPQPGAPALQRSTPPEWQAINNNAAAAAPQRQREQVAILQDELATEKDPANRAALEREITRAGGQGMNAIKAGAAAGMLGIPGGSGMIQYGQAMNEEPRKQAAEVRAERSEVRADKKFDMEARAEANKNVDRDAKRAETQAGDLGEYRSITGGLQRMRETVAELKKHPGLADNTGLSGIAKLYNLTEKGRGASTLLEDLKGKQVVQVLGDLKKSSANGSSGFGALSESENKRLEGYIANLSRAQSYSEMTKALEKLESFANEAEKNYTDKFNSLYGKPDSPNVAPSMGAQPQTPRGSAAPGIKFLGFE